MARQKADWLTNTSSTAPVAAGARSGETGHRQTIELDTGSNSLKWWTLSQRIRTFAERAFQVALLETAEPPKYQQIAERALHLNQLTLSNEAIARHIDVDGKTVAKALSWIRNRS